METEIKSQSGKRPPSPEEIHPLEVVNFSPMNVIAQGEAVHFVLRAKLSPMRRRRSPELMRCFGALPPYALLNAESP